MKAQHALMVVGVAIWLLATSNSHASEAANYQFEGNLMERATDSWLQGVKVKYADRFAYLKKLNDANSLPEGTLQTMWVVESMCGELNIRNDSGHTGHFQIGDYEAKKYGCDNPKDFKCAADATVRLLRDYHLKFQTYSFKPVDWKQREMVDFYVLHQQGFRGAAGHYNTIMTGAPLRPVIVANVRANTMNGVRGALFNGVKRNPSVTDREISVFFYRMWSHQMNHIWNIIK